MQYPSHWKQPKLLRCNAFQRIPRRYEQHTCDR
jgi:hypothetical protein